MNAVERVSAVLAGRVPDRAPVSFWYHFAPDEVYGPRAVAAHVNHLRKFDLDFLKVMNDNPYPHAGRIAGVGDLPSVAVALRGDEPEFARQLELIVALKREIGGRALMTTTIFNAWATLRHLAAPPKAHLPPNMDLAVDAASEAVHRMIEEDEAMVAKALGAIGQSLANFAARCLAAGADGIYLSVRDDWVDGPGARVGLYGRLVRPSDLQILNAASAGRFNMLHVCGKAVDFKAMARYPAHALSWADRAAGPSIAEVRDWLKPAICAGVDNLGTLPNGASQDCERQVRDAIRQAQGRPLMVAPGCTYDPARVPEANLRAVREAVEAGTGA